MSDLPIFFVAGLPRSGSTLLMNLLGQNPAHHVTPTNGLLELLVAIRDKWRDFVEFQSQGINNIKPRIISTMKGMVEGYYLQEFSDGKTVFDKSRGWLAYIEMMEQVLERPVTVIVTIRDVRAIVASFEKIHQRNPVTSARQANYFMGQTIEGRASMLLAENGVIGIAINRLRDALRRPHKSHILMISYNELCRQPQAVMNGLCDHLGLPYHTYDPEHVEQLTYEDDSVHGMPLHDIRSKVELLDETPWNGVLPERLCDAILADYRDIQQYCEAKR